MSQEGRNSNLKRDKIIRKETEGIEGKNQTVKLSKRAKGRKQEKQRKILFRNIAGVERSGFLGLCEKLIS